MSCYDSFNNISRKTTTSERGNIELSDNFKLKARLVLFCSREKGRQVSVSNVSNAEYIVSGLDNGAIYWNVWPARASGRF